MRFVVFALDVKAGLAVRHALRARQQSARFVDASGWCGEPEEGQIIIALHSGANEGQAKKLREIYEHFGGDRAHAFVAKDEATIAAFVLQLLGPEPEDKSPKAGPEVEPYEPPVALEPEPEPDEPDEDGPPVQIGRGGRR